jgi:hypothetical protein
MSCDRLCPLLSVIVGWNVAPMWPHGRRGGLLSSGSAVNMAVSDLCSRLETTWPRASPGATRSAVALGLFPSRPSFSALAPWKGRSRVPALDLDG